MKRPAFHALKLLVCLALVGCDGDDWGDKIAKFVDEEVHGLTESIAKNELDVRWFDYFNGLVNKSILVVDAATRLTDTTKIASAPLGSFDDREKALALIGAADQNGIEADRMLRAALTELDGAVAICESEGALHRVDIASLGSRIAGQIALPEADWYVELSCEFGGSGGDSGDANQSNRSGGSGCWKSLVSIVTAIFGADKQKQQKDKATEAIDRIPSRVVAGSEVEKISKESCKAMASAPLLQAGLKSARAALVDAQASNLSVSKALVAMRTSLETHQAPLLLQKVRDQSGIERTAKEISAEYASERVKQAVDNQRKDLLAFESRFQAARTCSEMLTSYDLFRRALEEKRSQLEAAAKSSSEFGANFSPLLGAIRSAQQALPGQRNSKGATLCG